MEETLLFSNFQILFIGLLLTLILVFKHRRVEQGNFPPRPPSLPIIGHLHLLKEPFHQTLQDLSQKYGPIISLSLGSRPVVVVSSASAAQECFTKNDIIFASRPLILAGKILNYDYTAVGATPYGQHWRIMRRIATTELLSTHRLNTLINVRQQEVKLWLKSLYGITGGSNYVRVDIKSKLTELSFNITLMLLIGKRYFGTEVEDYEEARKLKKLMKEIPLLSGAYPPDFLSVLKLIDYQGIKKRLVKLGVAADAFAQSLIDERRNSCSLEEHQDRNTMIDTLLSLQQSEPQYYKDHIIKGQFLTMLAAGTDTTAGTIEWAMSLLLNHPTTMKKAWTEINHCVGDQRLIEEVDISKLHYLHAIINETYRLFPALPMLVPRECCKGCTIGGFDVPKGTVLAVNAWAIHRDPKVWEDPTCFRPERFKEAGDTVDEPNKLLLLPFGMGRRACPGSGLAHRVVGLTLATLIQCFEWETLGHQKIDLSQGSGVTMPKATPLEAMCKPRTSIIHLLSQL